MPQTDRTEEIECEREAVVLAKPKMIFVSVYAQLLRLCCSSPDDYFHCEPEVERHEACYMRKMLATRILSDGGRARLANINQFVAVARVQ